MESIDIYYFTGTGNTLYIVNKLKELIPEINMIPVAQLFNVDGQICSKSKTIGFCFPNHAGHLPIPMKTLIRKLHLDGDEYLFAICNSAFSKSFAPEDIDKILKKKHSTLKAYFNLIMPDNHTIVNKNYCIPSKEEFKRCEDQVQAKIVQIKKIIHSKETFIENDVRPAPFPKWIDKTLRPLIFYLVEKHPSIVLKGSIYADSKCNGCKLCSNICPADRITILDDRPIFDCKKTCFGCYACINFCPVESLQVGSKWYNGRSHTAKNKRYPHPYATAKDIANQKKV